jgi:YHS domain-containing protein
MKLVIYLSIPIFLFSCNQASNTPNPDISSPPAVPSVIISIDSLDSPIDPVCEMEMNADGIADTIEWEGKIYGFCATECKTEFIKSPEAYLKP